MINIDLTTYGRCSADSPLADIQSAYSDLGYVVVSQLLREQAAVARRAVDELASLAREGRGPAVFAADDSTSLQVLVDTYARSPILKGVCSDAALLAVVRALLPAPIVVFGSGMCVYKEPGPGTDKLLHQDAPYFLHERHEVCLAFIVLGPCDESHGGLFAVPGSHRMGLLAHHDSRTHLALSVEPAIAPVPLRCEQGDVIFMNYLTAHGSGENRGCVPRPIMLVQYRSARDHQMWRSTSWTRFLGIPCEEGAALPSFEP
jgi:ectoine hydroxylase-related dioxygenase (phytanoyl-CoA dioxygenase family)